MSGRRLRIRERRCHCSSTGLQQHWPAAAEAAVRLCCCTYKCCSPGSCSHGEPPQTILRPPASRRELSLLVVVIVVVVVVLVVFVVVFVVIFVVIFVVVVVVIVVVIFVVVVDIVLVKKKKDSPEAIFYFFRFRLLNL